MPGTIRVFYWDACVFLAWLKDEERAAGEMEGVLSCVEAFDNGTAHLLTSALTIAEISKARITSESWSKFERVLRRTNATVQDVNPKIARFAGDLRDYYMERAAEFARLTLSTPDAIHVATAIQYGALEFHTFDKKNNRGTLGLLPLDGNIGGHRLAIKKPTASAQMPLDFKGTPDGQAEDDAAEDE